MAMAYENGTASSRYDLVNKMRIFLLANGWTINGYDGTEGGGLHVSKGGNYFNVFFSAQDANEDERLWLQLSMSTGYLAPDGAAQPGELFASTDNRCAVNFETALYQEYYFFLDLAADAFYCVVEEELGLYRHMAFGSYNVIGQAATAQCGQFVWGHYSHYLSPGLGYTGSALPAWAYKDSQNQSKTGSISVDRGSGREVFWNTDLGNGESYYYTGDVPADSGIISTPWGNKGFSYQLFEHSVNSFNNRVATIPINLWMGRPSSLRSLVGQFASVRLVNLKNIAPEQIIDGDWMCFPLATKAPGSSGWATGDVGLAYKKV